MSTLLRTLLTLLLLSANAVLALEGRIVDANSGAGIAGATITLDGQAMLTAADGRFHTDRSAERIQIRAPGYLATSATPVELTQAEGTLALAPFRPKALYLSAWTMAYRPKREAAMDLMEKAGLNAVVVDLKNDQGLVPYPSKVALATAVGARRATTMHNLAATVDRLHQRKLYAIARIVVFKDDLLAQAHPEWAVKLEDGSLYRDNEGLAWADAFHPEVRDYAVAIAVEAAQAGFDEIQFDYVRFPDALHLKLSQDNTEAARIGAIAALLTQARQALLPYNVFLSADIFGYVCWNENDTHIGQRLEDLMPLVDYLSPMLYPSGFQFGIPGFLDPVSHPYDVVRLSLLHAEHRLKVSGLRLRPWLQDFKDYAFDHRDFGADDVMAQIRAANEAGTDGFMIWNPRNVYSPLPAPTATPAPATAPAPKAASTTAPPPGPATVR